MPVLATEPHLSPNSLFSQIERGETKGVWWVLHTKPRCEKSLARHFRARGDSYFLPMGTVRRRIQRRWVESQLPLFPGYIFLYGSDQSFLHALETRKVVNSLVVDDEEGLHQDLYNLNRLIESNHRLSLQPKLTVGTSVEVTDGPLAGMRGIVTRCDGESRIIIDVKMLNQQVSAQIESCLLRKL